MAAMHELWAMLTVNLAGVQQAHRISACLAEAATSNGYDAKDAQACQAALDALLGRIAERAKREVKAMYETSKRSGAYRQGMAHAAGYVNSLWDAENVIHTDLSPEERSRRMEKLFGAAAPSAGVL